MTAISILGLALGFCALSIQAIILERRLNFLRRQMRSIVNSTRTSNRYRLLEQKEKPPVSFKI